MADKDWEMNLAHMESLIDDRTKAIVMNNPSNPTGAVYSKEHLTDFLKLCDKYGLTVIADEIYGRYLVVFFLF
jgi:tyrosine aminotransferase